VTYEDETESLNNQNNLYEGNTGKPLPISLALSGFE